MTRRFAAICLVWLACGIALADELPSAGADAVKQVLEAYEEAWSRHDARAIAEFYFEPAMRISPNGPVVRATRDTQEAFFTGLLANLVSQGYAGSTWEHLEVRLLDDDTAIASGVVTRRRADGTLFQRQAVTYGLWRTAQGWKIYLSATHKPSTELRFR